MLSLAIDRIMAGRCFIQINICIRDSFGCFSRIKKLLGRTDMRTRDRIYAFSQYEQFETSPETIEQELRPGVC